MKGGKHAEKTTTPMFPRLYVNDAEKGGPRPPSRNKMALYEKHSIPSRRLSSGSASMLPPPPSNLSRLVSSGSSSPVGDQERDVNGLVHTTTPLGRLPKNMEQNSKRKSATGLDCKVLNASGDLSPTSKCNLLQPCPFSLFESPFLKKHDDGFRDSTFPYVDEKLGSSSNEFDICGEKFNVLHMNTSIQLQSFGVTRFERPSNNDLELEKHLRNLAGKAPNFSTIGEKCNRLPSISTAKDNISLDVFSKPLSEDRVSKPNHSSASSNQECKSCPVDETDRLCKKARVELAKQGSEALGITVIEQPKVIEKDYASIIRSGLCDKFSHVEHQKSLQGLVDHSQQEEENKLKPLQTGITCRNDNISDTTYGVLFSPNDIIGLIGQTYFWKARKAIINQHRLFSMQVFELHRLIKVQKAIDGSLHLLEDSLILDKHLVEASLMKKLPKLIVQLPKPIEDSLLDKHLKIITPIENSTKKPLHAFKYDISKVAYSWSDFAKPSATSMGTDTRLAMWCFHPPPGNQWLVPMISPSEDLIYKPYTGPCPLLTGFMAPVCGGCGLLAITPSCSSSLYGGPTSHQHGMEFLSSTSLFLSYFAPYSRPAMNSAFPPVVQQVTTVAGERSARDETQLLMQDSNFLMPNQSSCNNSYCTNKISRDRDTELKGSTASSSPERIQKDVLPLFPMMSAAQDSGQTDLTYISGQETCAIKVVPHNPRLAAESATRIFQLIQEERK